MANQRLAIGQATPQSNRSNQPLLSQCFVQQPFVVQALHPSMRPTLCLAQIASLLATHWLDQQVNT